MRRAFVLAALIAGCGSTGQDVASFPIHGAGAGEATFESDGWSVTIERADVGFGPVYFCATTVADMDACEEAKAEWLGTASIDALDPGPQMLGEAAAITATVRSAMFDYGRSWLLTAGRPQANAGAPRGRSAVFVVRATKDGATLEVRASIDIDPANAGQSAVIGAPTGEAAIEGDEALTVRIDPAAWWRRIDFDVLAAMDEDGDGAVELARGDLAYEELVLAMTTRQLPAFEWTQP